MYIRQRVGTKATDIDRSWYNIPFFSRFMLLLYITLCSCFPYLRDNLEGSQYYVDWITLPTYDNCDKSLVISRTIPKLRQIGKDKVVSSRFTSYSHKQDISLTYALWRVNCIFIRVSQKDCTWAVISGIFNSMQIKLGNPIQIYTVCLRISKVLSDLLMASILGYGRWSRAAAHVLWLHIVVFYTQP